MIKAGCKINLGLKIIGKRADGYHEIRTILYPLSVPHDELVIEKMPEAGIQIDCSNLSIPLKQNILYKTWNNFSKLCKINFGLKIRLIKGIPDGAGLGGGSSDAALLLNWLNNTCLQPLDKKGMVELAFAIGADVPFFLEDRPCLASGAGEKLSAVGIAGEGLYILLVIPECKVQTAWAFTRYDEIFAEAQNSDNFLTNFMNAGNGISLSALPKNAFYKTNFLENDLEKAIFPSFPCMAALKTCLLDLGAVTASMSGSGSSIYGIFDSHYIAKKAEKVLRRHYSSIYFSPMRNY